MPATARSRIAATAAIISLLVPVAPAAANNLNESIAWQFMTPADLATQTAMRDMMERRRNGGYSAPNYTTNIARQYNCTVAANATGNNGAQSAVANSPTTTGATASSTGNADTTWVTGGRSATGATNGQSNSGPISSGVTGATTSTMLGTATQALNSDQNNSGNQTASVRDASACAFGVLN